MTDIELIGIAATQEVSETTGPNKVDGMQGQSESGSPVGAVVNPADEDAYWRNSYQTQAGYTPGYTYDDYAPAYALGYNGKSRYPGSYDQNETYLADEWNTTKGNSRLSWDQAKSASRAAWHKVERAIPGDFDRDGR